ncbi:MAG: extracellular solute-binding protein [Pseudomonadota bacterium]
MPVDAMSQSSASSAAVSEGPPGAHALAMHGAPALEEGFEHFPYVNPDAPQGGRLTIGLTGGFDSLNPFILRGRASRAIRSLVVESLMTRSQDEPFTLYGLLAERVETPEDRTSVTFYLHPEARFSNGDQVTVEDVIWSMETLRAQGRPNHRSYYSQIVRTEPVGERGVRFVFEAPNRELPLLMGLMPVLSKADWAGRDFETGGLRPILGSGPYKVAQVEAGRRILFEKSPDYWAADLPVNRGRHNFEQIEHLYFRTASALWEGFTAGAVDLYSEYDPARWVEAYDVPAVQDGSIERAAFEHGRPSGMDGFVFNTRRAKFQDRRVRAALALALDYAWVNERFHRGGFARIESYFSGSSLGFENPAGPAENALLAPFADDLPAGALEEAWRPPEGAGDGRNRRNMRAARRLLADAGWTLQDGRLLDADGRAFAFEILLSTNQPDRIAQVFVDAVAGLGIAAEIRQIDSAQYEERLLNYDYDMILRRWWLSLSPGEEQRFYWSASAGAAPGSRNYMGVSDPAVDAMVDAMLAARDREGFETAVRALDRVLSSGIYVIPLGYLEKDLLAWRRGVGVPKAAPLYGIDAVQDAYWRASE